MDRLGAGTLINTGAGYADVSIPMGRRTGFRRRFGGHRRRRMFSRFRQRVHVSGIKQLLKHINVTLTESAVSGTETITTLFSAVASPANEQQMFQGSYLTKIRFRLVLQLQGTANSGARHEVLLYKNEGGNTITSATPNSDWGTTSAFPVSKNTADIRRFKLFHHMWAIPAGATVPIEIVKTIRVPRRLQRFDIGDVLNIVYVQNGDTVGAKYYTEIHGKAYKN